MTTDGPNVLITRLPHGADLPLPAYQTDGAAGADIMAAIPNDTPVTLVAHGGMARVPTGVAIALPEGWEAQMRPRSGLAAKHGITLVNAPGTIDADYRGELQAILINHGPKDVTLHRGDRVGQLVFAPAPQATFEEVSTLPETARGSGGFGSTGK